ncbi:MAG: hypothetical protein CMP48_26150 [Rickettsiales bacterium]|nr:hypothetical protein [Rickettsiales bacterium]
MKVSFKISLFLLLVIGGSHLFAQTKDAKIKKCEGVATPFKEKIDQNHIYSYIAHLAYIDCLIQEFPEYKQQYIDTQILPNLRVIKQWGTLSDMPADSKELLKKYWELK